MIENSFIFFCCVHVIILISVQFWWYFQHQVMLYSLFTSCFRTCYAFLFIYVFDINFRYPQNIRHFVIFPCTWYSLWLLCSQQWEPSMRWYLLKNTSFHWEAKYEKSRLCSVIMWDTQPVLRPKNIGQLSRSPLHFTV